MISYRIIDYRIQNFTVSVEFSAVDDLDVSYANYEMPRLEGQWLTGTDLDRFFTLYHPKNRTRKRAELTEAEQIQYDLDMDWLETLNSVAPPQTHPESVIDAVISYRQSKFLEFAQSSTQLSDGPRVFSGNGAHSWTVPQDREYVTIFAYSTGFDDLSQGPGVAWNSQCKVTPGDTVNIVIGTQTTIASSLGTVELGAGWADPMARPQDQYYIEPWGYCGRPGAVIIF